MTYNNYDITHSFFYSGFNKTLDKNYKNMSYNQNNFYSYYTIIGTVQKNKNGENVLLYSENSMTPTTGRHLSYLRHACPFTTKSIYFEYGMHVWSWDMAINNHIKILENYLQNSNLNQKENRQKAIFYYNTLKYFIDNFNLSKENTKKIKDTLKKYHEHIEILQDTQKNYLKRISAKNEILQKKQNQKEKKFINSVLKKYTYHDMIFNLFNKNFDDNNTKTLKQYLHTNQYSYIWLDNDNKTIKTSQHISMPVSEIMPLIKLYKHNKLKHGMACGCYTILSITNNYIKIGCHVIPIQNINSLIEKIGA